MRHQLVALRETYRRADLRLRRLLFGDSVYSSGRLKGEESRVEAIRELRLMRSAFAEVLEEADAAHKSPEPQEGASGTDERSSHTTREPRPLSRFRRRGEPDSN